MDLTDFGTVVQSEEDEYESPTQYMKKTHQSKKPAKSLSEKREEFRIQIRQEKMNEIFSMKRKPFLETQQRITQLPPVQTTLRQLQVAKESNNQEDLLSNLQVLGILSSDENRVNSIYLLKHGFVNMICQFLGLCNAIFLEQIYLILLNMSQDSEYFAEVSNSYLRQTVQMAYLQLPPQATLKIGLLQNILIYLTNVCKQDKNLRDQLLQMEVLEKISQIKEQTQCESVGRQILLFLQSYSQHFPEQLRNQMQLHYTVINQWLEDCLQTDVLAALLIVNKQATIDSMKHIQQTQIIQFLIKVMKNGTYEDFYGALQRTKEIALIRDLTITTILINTGIIEIIDRYVYHTYQKLRTAALHIVMAMCQSNDEIISQVLTNSIIQKLINVLVTDKPVNKSLVLETIINIMTYGREPVYVKLLDLGIIRQLPVTLDCQEAQILIQGIKCAELLLEFGQRQMINNNLSYNPILQKMNECNLIRIIDGLQHDKNQEVFNQASTFLQTFFEFEPVA